MDEKGKDLIARYESEVAFRINTTVPERAVITFLLKAEFIGRDSSNSDHSSHYRARLNMLFTSSFALKSGRDRGVR